MSSLPRSSNHFLASLWQSDHDLVVAHTRPVFLSRGTILFSRHEIIDWVHFPNAGVVSMLVLLPPGAAVQVGIVGRNSIVGSAAILDGGIAINQAVVQVEGSATAISSETLKTLARDSETLRIALGNHELAALAQAQQVGACNATHQLEARLCRSLLQMRDLVHSDTLPATQELLAAMLGVQRSSVTIAARKLQTAGLISYRRGLIHVLDRDALRASSCGCYAALNSHYDRLIGWRPDHPGDDRIAA